MRFTRAQSGSALLSGTLRAVQDKIGRAPPVANGLGVAILSTPKGVMSDAEARTQNVGGEVLCTVF